jgi:hypothetical protein
MAAHSVEKSGQSLQRIKLGLSAVVLRTGWHLENTDSCPGSDSESLVDCPGIYTLLRPQVILIYKQIWRIIALKIPSTITTGSA